MTRVDTGRRRRPSTDERVEEVVARAQGASIETASLIRQDHAATVAAAEEERDRAILEARRAFQLIREDMHAKIEAIDGVITTKRRDRADRKVRAFTQEVLDHDYDAAILDQLQVRARERGTSVTALIAELLAKG